MDKRHKEQRSIHIPSHPRLERLLQELALQAETACFLRDGKSPGETKLALVKSLRETLVEFEMEIRELLKHSDHPSPTSPIPTVKVVSDLDNAEKLVKHFGEVKKPRTSIDDILADYNHYLMHSDDKTQKQWWEERPGWIQVAGSSTGKISQEGPLTFRADLGGKFRLLMLGDTGIVAPDMGSFARESILAFESCYNIPNANQLGNDHRFAFERVENFATCREAEGNGAWIVSQVDKGTIYLKSPKSVDKKIAEKHWGDVGTTKGKIDAESEIENDSGQTLKNKREQVPLSDRPKKKSRR